jgi:toxin ParE1/3/4
MTFDFHGDALREYEEAGLWYEEQRRFLGVEFTQAIDLAIAAILANPERYQPVGQGIRIFRVKRFPYYIYYKWEEPRLHVRVVAIMHSRRRPDYWQDRLQDSAGD